ncbi:PPE family protein [Mycobacterium sp.]|uniref:PPE family protein n=1 Tax=Mycobacterium sp. TaxID=1785 RepID=UPI002CE8AC34|nr:PPE family protein [Mycobacterium sp.]HTY33131.1 PPE family protein [Mycobacterium sp.]
MTSPHFAWLPPEINSALIFAGPGAAPLLAAAEAWDGLAEDLASSASSFFSVTSDLANGSWQGASAAAMMAVATQYVSWLSAAAAQAEAASSQAAAIAAAFESALAATVQPAVVAANRALVQALASTNWFGLNAPAIMDTEAAYEAMWASDVAAMFGYHADASMAAAQLAPWQQVLQKLGFSFNNGKFGFGPLSLSLGNSNVGFGNSGNLNVGSGNSGNNNFGLGNLGNNNFGLGNSGSNDFGIGLTGSNQIGIGGFNSGTGNIGFFNSGSNNIGFFNSGTGNMGIGNAGTSNTGLLNSGSVNAGFFNSGSANTGFFMDNGMAGHSGQDTGMLNSGSYMTGSVGAANLSSGLLNSAAATGGLNAGLSNAALLNPASAAVAGPADTSALAGSLQSGAANAVAGPAGGPTPTPPALRTTTSPAAFFPASGTEEGVRNLTGRESGIPNSSFFNKGDRPPGTPDPGIGEPVSPD